MTDRRPASIPKTLTRSAAALGVLGLAATCLGLEGHPARTLLSYLFAFAYWSSLTLGAFLMLMTFHAAEARWVAPLRRVVEWFTSAVPLTALAFIPLWVGRHQLYRWARPEFGPPSSKNLFAFKRVYLNESFWTGRAALFLLSWAAISTLLVRWSAAQDRGDRPLLTRRLQVLGAIALPWFFLSATFATYDWMMSLDPDWSSEIYGLCFLAGAYLAATAAVIPAVLRLMASGRLKGLSGDVELHNFSKLLFTAVCLWAYVGYSQYMLIWIANEPEELGWIHLRTSGFWEPVFDALIWLHFTVPFFALLGRQPKVSPGYLKVICLFLLGMHAVDLAWVLLPSGDPSHPVWTDLAAWVGLGGVFAAFTAWQIDGTAPVPWGDPAVAERLAVAEGVLL